MELAKEKFFSSILRIFSHKNIVEEKNRASNEDKSEITKYGLIIFGIAFIFFSVINCFLIYNFMNILQSF